VVQNALKFTDFNVKVCNFWGKTPGIVSVARTHWRGVDYNSRHDYNDRCRPCGQ